jgi:lysyl-tRNA synthetase class I
LGVVPKAVDEYFQFRAQWHDQPVEKRLGNPVHHIHNGEPPAETLPVTFGLLLNLVGVMGEASKEQVWEVSSWMRATGGILGAALPTSRRIKPCMLREE